MIFEQNRAIYYSQLAPNKSVSRANIVQFFQDIAVSHTTESGYSLEKLADLNRAWILLSMHVRFSAPIPLYAKIRIKTWTYEFARACGPRAYQIEDTESGKIYASAAAMWTYIDTQTGRPKEIPQEMLSYFGNGDAPDITYLRRAPDFVANNHIADFKILKRDLDSNGHMNNVKYLEYAEEVLPDDAAIKEIEIFYKHPVFLGEKISLYSERKGENLNLILKNHEGTNCAYIKFVLE